MKESPEDLSCVYKITNDKIKFEETIQTPLEAENKIFQHVDKVEDQLKRGETLTVKLQQQDKKENLARKPPGTTILENSEKLSRKSVTAEPSIKRFDETDNKPVLIVKDVRSHNEPEHSSQLSIF